MSSTPRKNKIELSNYNYVRDIENRLLMAQLTCTEVDILKEILNGSLKFNTRQLADALDLDENTLIPILDKLSQTKLLQRYADSVTVDKEMRKYYEIQILKFDEDFEPGMEFLQSLFSKVPIHVLPNWYSISRISDNIFHSIIEKYLLTPKVFERYLQETNFEDPTLDAICADVLTAPDFKMFSRDLTQKYSLSHEQFEKHMLLLEYSLICCIGYEMINGKWEEVVTPFHEWREYLRFLRDTAPETISNPLSIQRLHPHDFGFVKDLHAILKSAKSAPIQLEHSKISPHNFSLSSSITNKILPHLTESSLAPTYSFRLIDRLLQLQLATITNSQLHPTNHADEWLKLTIQDQAHSLYRLPPYNESPMSKFSDKDVREVEKSLRRVIRSGWIYFDSFFIGLLAHIGDTEPVTLKNKGKRWKYSLPTYNDDHRAFVEATLLEKLFETGMVAIGTHNDKLCFSITPFGRMSLGE